MEGDQQINKTNEQQNNKEMKRPRPKINLVEELAKPTLPRATSTRNDVGGKPPVSAMTRKHHGPKGLMGVLLAVVFMGLGLGVGILFLGKFLPQPVVREVLPEASGSAVPTGIEGVTPTPGLQFLTVADLGFDEDGDAIPDRLEEILGYDPSGNDCTRRLGCGDFPTVPRAKLEINLLFLLDASGSMTEKLEGVTRWESAKAALLDLLNSGLPRFANVGLIVYGHEGSSSLADQQASCAGVELLDPLSGVDLERTQDLVNRVDPVGWTSIGGALELAGRTLEGKDFAQNFVILLSDGKETCGGDPAGVARNLHESGIEVVTNVVGLAVDADEQEQLELIAQSGGGRYFPANSRNELGQALILAAEAVRLWDQVNQCILDNLSVYGECVNVQYLRSLNYVDGLRIAIGKERGTVSGGGFIEKEYENLYRRIWDQFNDLRQDNWEQYDEDLRKLYPR